jgi:predicted glycosyltransferase
VLITARDHQPTLEVLANRGEAAVPVGGSFGISSASKAFGTLARAARLRLLVGGRIGRPRAVVSTARSGVLAAWALRAPAFTVLDYEGVELGVFKRAGTVLLHPSVVPAERFIERGFPAGRLRSFPGLKEDLSFSGLDIDSTERVKLPAPRNASLPAVLVRPPSQTSHYRADKSVHVLELVVGRLARRDDVQVVFAPREAAQAEMLTSCAWAVPPVTLDRPLPLVELLRAVDWVITGGGTMLREAAWLGVPGVTVFQGPMPAVDEWLEAEGVIRRISDPEDVDAIDWARPPSHTGVNRHPEALDLVINLIEREASPY